MSFLIYIAGAILVIGGLVYGAVLVNVPTQWIVAGSIVAVGLSVLAAVKVTRPKDMAR